MFILYIFLRNRKRDLFQIDSVIEKFKPSFKDFKLRIEQSEEKKYQLFFWINVKLFIYYFLSLFFMPSVVHSNTYYYMYLL